MRPEIRSLEMANPETLLSVLFFYKLSATFVIIGSNVL